MQDWPQRSLATPRPMPPRLDDNDRARILNPALGREFPDGIGGSLRNRVEDFRVWEIPAYAADGRDQAHLLFTLEKQGWNTEDALRLLADKLGVPRSELGIAGLKDRNAITTQWVSAPSRTASLIEQFEHDALRLGKPLPHSNKLRRGHLHGNRFEIVVRNVNCDLETALARARLITEELNRRGLANVYGEQRFGHHGQNIERGLEALASKRRRKRAEFVMSAGQSALFNLYLELRRESGTSRKILEGDVLKKTITGGLFVCQDPASDQPRLESGELEITGPIFGSKMRSPPPGSPSAELEAEVLERGKIRASALHALGRSVPGTRRRLRITPSALSVRVAPAVGPTDGALLASPTDHADGLLGSGGIAVEFSLPSGSYATVLLRELMNAGGSPRQIPSTAEGSP